MVETPPKEELERRLTRFQERLAAQEVSLALIRQPADMYYYAGMIADGFVAVPAAGVPRLLVRRPQERLSGSKPGLELAFYRDFNEMQALLGDLLPPSGARVGLELDVLPAAFYLLLQEKVFPRHFLVDVSLLIRHQRMVKSAYELEQIRRAAAILTETFALIPGLLRPGLTELELAAALEYQLRLRGHQGLIRLRGFTLEMFYGHVLSGPAGLELAYTDTPSGGLGLSPAFPQGPSLKAVQENEPVSVDLASCINGYLADMTRLFVLGDLPAEAWRIFALILDLYQFFQTAARPGVLASELFAEIQARVAQAGYQEIFMGPGKEKVRFVGHGVGLELDEFPLLSDRFPHPLESDMVLAFEPKFFLPGVGLIGLEDTGRITPGGVEWLTTAPREVIKV